MANRANVLRVLADVLEEKERTEKSGFHMSSFVDLPDMAAFTDDTMTLQAGQSPTMCGTTLCVAGFAALGAGWKFKFTKAVGWDGEDYARVRYINPDGVATRTLDFETIGKDYLGISTAIAGTLFYATSDDGTTAIKILEHLAMDPEADYESVSLIYGRQRYLYDMEHYGSSDHYNEDGACRDDD